MTIALSSIMTADTTVRARNELLRAVQQLPAGQGVTLDAAAVQSFDSAGLALLLVLRRAAQQQGRSLSVQSWPDSLRALAQTYGVLTLLDPLAQSQG